MKPIYKDLKFDSLKDFKKWLKKTTYKTIYLKDKGQDVTKFYIADNGEIIHSNLQSLVWNGMFVEMKTLKENTDLVIWNGKSWNKMDFEIEKVKTEKIFNQ